MDLAKVVETKHLNFPLYRPELLNETINKLLRKGWVILTVKIVEDRGARRENDGKLYPHATSSLFYVLGRPREKPKSPDEQSEEWRRKHLPINDARHPDYFLHAKSST